MSLEIKERADKYRALWGNQATTATEEQLGALGFAYLRHVLGMDDRTIDFYLRRGEVDLEEVIDKAALEAQVDALEHIMPDKASRTVTVLRNLANYYLKALGLTMQNVESFALQRELERRNQRADQEFASRQRAYTRGIRENSEGFWREVTKIFPEDYTDEDLRLLIEYQLERDLVLFSPLTVRSELLMKLRDEACFYDH